MRLIEGDENPGRKKPRLIQQLMVCSWDWVGSELKAKVFLIVSLDYGLCQTIAKGSNDGPLIIEGIFLLEICLSSVTEMDLQVDSPL